MTMTVGKMKKYIRDLPDEMSILRPAHYDEFFDHTYSLETEPVKWGGAGAYVVDEKLADEKALILK